jgi:hypothetical protein
MSGVQVLGEGNGLGAVRSGAHDVDVGQQPEDHRQSLPDDSLIVGDEDADRLAHAGTSSSTRKPLGVPGSACA